MARATSAFIPRGSLQRCTIHLNTLLSTYTSCILLLYAEAREACSLHVSKDTTTTRSCGEPDGRIFSISLPCRGKTGDLGSSVYLYRVSLTRILTRQSERAERFLAKQGMTIIIRMPRHPPVARRLPAVHVLYTLLLNPSRSFSYSSLLDLFWTKIRTRQPDDKRPDLYTRYSPEQVFQNTWHRTHRSQRFFVNCMRVGDWLGTYSTISFDYIFNKTRYTKICLEECKINDKSRRHCLYIRWYMNLFYYYTNIIRI